MTQSVEEIMQIAGLNTIAGIDTAADFHWAAAKKVIGDRRVVLGPQASDQYLNAPEDLAMVLARYRAAGSGFGFGFAT